LRVEPSHGRMAAWRDSCGNMPKMGVKESQNDVDMMLTNAVARVNNPPPSLPSSLLKCAFRRGYKPQAKKPARQGHP
jgi:hypothetical protein